MTAADQLLEARAELVRLIAVATALTGAYRATYGDDMAVVSGTRRKASPRADARKFGAADREARAWGAVRWQEGRIEEMEHRAKVAERNKPVPYTLAELKAAHAIRTKRGWHEVVRVSAKSVTVRTPWSWDDRVLLADVIEVRSL